MKLYNVKVNMRIKLISFIAIILMSSGVFAQVKGGHAGVNSGGRDLYEDAFEAERAFVGAYNECVGSKIRFYNFRDIYLSLNVTEISSQLNKIEPNQNTSSCKSSNCIIAPKVREQLRNFLAVEGFDDYIRIYCGLVPSEVKKDINKWLSP